MDEPRRADGLEQPIAPLHLGGSSYRRGLREGLAIATILALGGLLTGVVTLAGGHGPATSPSPAVAYASPTPSVGSTGALVPTATRPPSTGPTTCGTTSPERIPVAKLLMGDQWVYGASGGQTWNQRLDATLPLEIRQVSAAALTPDVPLVIALDDPTCAFAWRVTANGVLVAVQSNSVLDPARAASSIVVPVYGLTGPVTTLRAELQFGGGWTVTTWQLLVPTLGYQPVADRPALPQASVSDADETVVASPGCDFTFSFDGASTSDNCRTSLLSDVASTLTAMPGDELQFGVAGATVDSELADTTDLQCGKLEGSPVEFSEDAGCSLEPSLREDDLVIFHAPTTRGVWWVRIHLAFQVSTAVIDASIDGSWFVVVDTSRS